MGRLSAPYTLLSSGYLPHSTFADRVQRKVATHVNPGDQIEIDSETVEFESRVT